MDIRKKILSSLYYPMLLLGATFVTIIFLLTYVIPSFEDIFQTFNAQLPYPTRVILFLSKNIKKNYIYIILFLIVFILLIRLYFNTDNGSHIRDKLILKLPFISKIKKYIILWRFSNMLNLLIKNGLSLLESLIIVEKITKNRVIKKMIHTIQINIREGQDLATALSESNFFPKINFIIFFKQKCRALPRLGSRKPDKTTKLDIIKFKHLILRQKSKAKKLYILTSMFTPLGNVKFLSASNTFGLASITSISLLCTLTSYCSFDLLFTKVDLLTVYFLISVGRGVGPDISLPYLVAVSTICFALLSITL